MPRALSLGGRWVPSLFDVYVFLPLLAAVICVVGMRLERSPVRSIGLVSFILVGLLLAGMASLMFDDRHPADEGIWPVPPDLHVVSQTEGCGSACLRGVSVTGERAAERIREHLRSHGYAPRPSEMCRVNGVVLTYTVCTAVTEDSPTAARVEWYM
ncbi:hypothetical protein LWC34_00085 [Kibdelosporangium philippinense]|uniref:Uncharacterized protein n=1 Tax=Kibdelosporangium philippinense TaxID=211113 RepID=A0ABS8YZT7_9PSEU|nr:hypothetical protein [Kibdelosporangium philippinense]MCE7001246.1 hypothetical protein [Kibdelosporangium philippinense]